MNSFKTAAIIIIASALIVLLINSVFIVDQTEQIVITRFGQPVRKPITEPGLHFKIPFIEMLNRFEKRILRWDGNPSQVPTRDKKFIWVDLTARWRIQDPLKFIRTMHNEQTAMSRLDDIMDGITRNFITRYNLPDIVRSTNRILDIKVADEDVMGETDYEKIEIGRDAITRQILESTREVVVEYGIELIDIRVKRINYIQSVQEKVFDRMISERKRAAEQLRSEGQGIRAEIEGQKEKELRRLTSEAYRKAQKIRGDADAESTNIYGEAYSKDADFYAFMATLEKYPETLKNGRLLLTTDSDFLEYLKKAK